MKMLVVALLLPALATAATVLPYADDLNCGRKYYAYDSLQSSTTIADTQECAAYLTRIGHWVVTRPNSIRLCSIEAIFSD